MRFSWQAYSVEAGPFGEQDSNSRFIGPNNTWTWFGECLRKGSVDYRDVVTPLDTSAKAKLHNIRGVQVTSSGANQGNPKIMQRWDWYDVTRNRLPRARTIIEPFGGAGDGVIPAGLAERSLL